MKAKNPHGIHGSLPLKVANFGVSGPLRGGMNVPESIQWVAKKSLAPHIPLELLVQPSTEKLGKNHTSFRKWWSLASQDGLFGLLRPLRGGAENAVSRFLHLPWVIHQPSCNKNNNILDSHG